jgi:hypothetical protein
VPRPEDRPAGRLVWLDAALVDELARDAILMPTAAAMHVANAFDAAPADPVEVVAKSLSPWIDFPYATQVGNAVLVALGADTPTVTYATNADCLCGHMYVNHYPPMGAACSHRDCACEAFRPIDFTADPSVPNPPTTRTTGNET